MLTGDLCNSGDMGNNSGPLGLRGLTPLQTVAPEMSIPTLQDRETVAGMSALYANDKFRSPPMGKVIKQYARSRARD